MESTVATIVDDAGHGADLGVAERADVLLR
jgi:hypothetical protein